MSLVESTARPVHAAGRYRRCSGGGAHGYPWVRRGGYRVVPWWVGTGYLRQGTCIWPYCCWPSIVWTHPRQGHPVRPARVQYSQGHLVRPSQSVPRLMTRGVQILA